MQPLLTVTILQCNFKKPKKDSMGAFLGIKIVKLGNHPVVIVNIHSLTICNGLQGTIYSKSLNLFVDSGIYVCYLKLHVSLKFIVIQQYNLVCAFSDFLKNDWSTIWSSSAMTNISWLKGFSFYVCVHIADAIIILRVVNLHVLQ